MDVAQLRRQIPTCQRMIYMNTGWSGPSPVPVVEAIKERLEYESYSGPTTREVLETGCQLRQRVQEAVAQLLGVSSEEICLTQNTTEGLNLALNGLAWQPEDEIVTFSIEHSSVQVPAYYLQRRYGVRVRVISLAPNEGHEAILAKLEESLTNKIRLLFFSHIQFASGLRMPLEGIVTLTRARGIKVLVDGAQAAGHIPLDAGALGCDFYSIPGHKWLLGPDGVGALYIRRDLIPQVAPVVVSGHAALSFDARHFEPRVSSVEKFQLTTSSGPLLAGFLEAIKFNQRIGSEEIEKRVLGLATSLKRLLLEIPGVELLTPLEGSSSCGLVSFRPKGLAPQDAVNALWERYKIVGRAVAQTSAVRLSLAFFNTQDEIDQAAAAVAELASARK